MSVLYNSFFANRKKKMFEDLVKCHLSDLNTFSNVAFYANFWPHCASSAVFFAHLFFFAKHMRIKCSVLSLTQFGKGLPQTIPLTILTKVNRLTLRAGQSHYI